MFTVSKNGQPTHITYINEYIRNKTFTPIWSTGISLPNLGRSQVQIFPPPLMKKKKIKIQIKTKQKI